MLPNKIEKSLLQQAATALEVFNSAKANYDYIQWKRGLSYACIAYIECNGGGCNAPEYITANELLALLAVEIDASVEDIKEYWIQEALDKKELTLNPADGHYRFGYGVRTMIAHFSGSFGICG